MEYRNIGRSGLQVSVVGLGGNNFGDRVDAASARPIVEKAIDLGVTFFDTADVYGSLWGGQRGSSEEILGAALKPHRRNVVITTKANAPMGQGPYWAGAARRYIMDALEDSLRRLGTDYIDLYVMHRPDPLTPIEETLRALDDMVRSGKVRYIGCSQYAAWQLVEAEWASRSSSLERYICILSEYNMLRRAVQNDVLPVCERYDIGLVPLWPLANGLLTGKYRPGEPPPAGSRLADPPRWAQGVLTESNLAVVARLEEFGKRAGRSLVEIAVGWLLSQPVVSSVIAGSTSLAQLEQNVGAAGTRFSADEMAELNSIIASG